jgi:ATP-dependent exoDNAse (exonuclease V) beta subunit
VLREHSIRRELRITDAPGRKRMERTAESLRADTAEAAARVAASGTASIRFVTVTESAKDTETDPALHDGRGMRGGGRGKSWGNAVHRCMEALGRGRTGESLRVFAGAVAREEGLSDEHAAELVPLIERTAESDAWKKLVAAGVVNTELTVMRAARSDGVETITEGKIDAAALGADGWRVVDWKSDVVDDAAWGARSAAYAKQVGAYVQLLAELSGEKAVGSVERVPVSS